MPQRKPDQKKVFWSEIERNLLIERAVDIQVDRPDLSGLPLLRAAMTVLPSDRRRTLVSTSQVTWFNKGVRAESKRRADAVKSNGMLIAAKIVPHEDDPYTTILRENMANTATTAAIVTEQAEKVSDWIARNEEAMESTALFQRDSIVYLVSILKALQKLCDHVGVSTGVPRPINTSRPKNRIEGVSILSDSDRACVQDHYPHGSACINKQTSK